jgi:release factor glutamine methyltransferase
VHATELSQEALRVAQSNTQRLGLQNVRLHQGSWLQPLEGKFQMIVSNPPYVSRHDPHLQQGDCLFEPQMALSPGDDGLCAIREITANSADFLHASGWLLVEHGYDQGSAVRSLFNQAGFVNIRTESDMASLERVCMGQRTA